VSQYDAVFFDYVSTGATRSAERVWPHLLGILPIRTILDVGCGRGAWLSVAMSLGVAGVTGVDGSYVDTDRLLIPSDRFVPADLQDGFKLPDRYDLVMSLEVAEHLSAARSAGFVEDLVSHGDLILFSAAPKGQGGHAHVNEQDYSYWQKLFAAHGYVAIDYLRPLLKNVGEIEPWYRYNTVLYAASERLATLPPVIRNCALPPGVPIADVSPLPYRIRKALIRCFPVWLMTALARVKESVTASLNG